MVYVSCTVRVYLLCCDENFFPKLYQGPGNISYSSRSINAKKPVFFLCTFFLSFFLLLPEAIVFFTHSFMTSWDKVVCGSFGLCKDKKQKKNKRMRGWGT